MGTIKHVTQLDGYAERELGHRSNLPQLDDDATTFIFFNIFAFYNLVMMKAFLSYTFGDDVSAVKVLLNEHAVEIFDSQFDLEVRESSQRSIRDAIKNCDFVVFIYSNDSLFIAFEAGFGKFGEVDHPISV